MISFVKGTSGSVPRFTNFLAFNHENNKYFINPILEKYFLLKDDVNGEIELISVFYNKIIGDIRYYS